MVLSHRFFLYPIASENLVKIVPDYLVNFQISEKLRAERENYFSKYHFIQSDIHKNRLLDKYPFIVK